MQRYYEGRELNRRERRRRYPSPLKVIVVSPKPGRQGGISRMVGYLADAWAQQPAPPEVIIVDPGGSRSTLDAALRLSAALVRVAFEAIAARSGTVIHVHMATRASTWRKLPFLWLGRLIATPTILHVHGAEFDTFVRGCPRLLRWVLTLAFQGATKVIVLGSRSATFVKDEMGVSKDNVLVLPNASPGPDSVRSPSHRTAPIQILFLGQIGTRKGVPELIGAITSSSLQELPWTAVIAGDGDAAAYCRQVTFAGLASRVRFTGWVAPSEVTRLLEGSDVLVLPSHAEGCPMAVVEAMAHGLAVIASNTGGIPDIITANVDGILVPPGDPVWLARELRSVIVDSTLRLALSRNARKKWSTSLNIDDYAPRLLDDFTSLVE